MWKTPYKLNWNWTSSITNWNRPYWFRQTTTKKKMDEEDDEDDDDVEDDEDEDDDLG